MEREIQYYRIEEKLRESSRRYWKLIHGWDNKKARREEKRWARCIARQRVHG